MWLVGVVVRRYLDFLIILLIPTPPLSTLFCSSIPTCYKSFFVLVIIMTGRNGCGLQSKLLVIPLMSEAMIIYYYYTAGITQSYVHRISSYLFFAPAAAVILATVELVLNSWRYYTSSLAVLRW